MKHKFRVGDIVIGNEKANHSYSVTVQGWKGKVIEVCGSKITIAGFENNDGYDGHDFGVSDNCFDLYRKTDTEEEDTDDSDTNDVAKICRGELYEIIFGLSHHDCPTENCDECPLEDDCDHDSWWNKPLDVIPDILKGHQGTKVARPVLSNPEHKRTTLTGLEGLAEEYNYSDSAGLAYLTDDRTITLTSSQRREVETLVLLNSLIFEYNSDLYKEEDYRQRYTILLEDLGITFDSQGFAHADSKKGETS